MDSTQLAESGTYVQAAQPWYSTVTSRRSWPWTLRLTGQSWSASGDTKLTCRYQIATGSGDDTVRIWDLRALKTQYIIPAHKSSVSDLKFFRSSSELPHVPLDVSLPTGLLPAVPDAPADDAPADTKPDIKPVLNGDGSGDVEMAGNEQPGMGQLPKSGLFLVTAGFDCNVRIWSADEWALIRNLATDAGKVMSVDISPDSKFIASASYSRSFHLFGGDNSL